MSSITEEFKQIIAELKGDLLEIGGNFFNKWDYLEMHQLEPCTQYLPTTQRDINKRLDRVMLNDRL